MKRKLFSLAVLVLMASVLSGCCLLHDWQDATCTAPKTCTKCDRTEGAALGHNWAPASCEAPETCQYCGLTQGEALGHDWQDASCTTPATCTQCGAAQLEKKPHTVLKGELILGDKGLELKGLCEDCGTEVSGVEQLPSCPVGLWKGEIVTMNGQYSQELEPDAIALDFRADGTYDLMVRGAFFSGGNWQLGGGISMIIDGVMVCNLLLDMTMTQTGEASCWITGKDIDVMHLQIMEPKGTYDYTLRREK